MVVRTTFYVALFLMCAEDSLQNLSYNRWKKFKLNPINITFVSKVKFDHKSKQGIAMDGICKVQMFYLG